VGRQRPASRLAAARVPSSSPGLQAAADDLVSRGQPGRWLDAVMDLASGTCTAHVPLCDACPVAALCASRGMVVAIEPKAAPVPFAMTSRWLRGRLVAAVMAAPAGTWVALPARLGEHDEDAIGAAAHRLDAGGVIDLHGADARVRQVLRRVV